MYRMHVLINSEHLITAVLAALHRWSHKSRSQKAQAEFYIRSLSACDMLVALTSIPIYQDSRCLLANMLLIS